MAKENETIRDDFLVVMGTAGTGKSEIGRRLAASLQRDFVEANELHTGESVEEMRKGIALTDAQRQPWLTQSVIGPFPCGPARLSSPARH